MSKNEIFNIKNVAHHHNQSIVFAEFDFQLTHSLNVLITLHHHRNDKSSKKSFLFTFHIKKKILNTASLTLLILF